MLHKGSSHINLTPQVVRRSCTTVRERCAVARTGRGGEQAAPMRRGGAVAGRGPRPDGHRGRISRALERSHGLVPTSYQCALAVCERRQLIICTSLRVGQHLSTTGLLLVPHATAQGPIKPLTLVLLASGQCRAGTGCRGPRYTRPRAVGSAGYLGRSSNSARNASALSGRRSGPCRDSARRRRAEAGGGMLPPEQRHRLAPGRSCV